MDNLPKNVSSLSIGQQEEDNSKSKDMECPIWQCPICKQPATMNCSACKLVAYCSADHQRVDWKNHKKVCLQPFTIKKTEDMGLGWFATRDLEAGVMVLEESPAIQAPTWSNDRHSSYKKCLTCGARSTKMGSCSTCSWPVCNDKCEKDPLHKDNECKEWAIRKLKYPPPASWPVGMLTIFMRALVMKRRDPKKFKQLMALQDYFPFPPTNEGFQKIDLPAGMFEVLSGPDSLDRDEFRKLLRILTANGSGFRPDTADFQFEDKKGFGPLELNLRVFLKTARLNHSCFANCVASFGPAPAYKMRIRTAIAVKKGEQLAIDVFEARGFDVGVQITANRQNFFKALGFICKCKRCLDPSEMGTCPKGVKCFNCPSPSKSDGDNNMVGYFLPMFPNDDYSVDSPFECNRCHVQHPISLVIHTLPAALRSFLANIHNLTFADTVDHKALEAALTKYEEDKTINGYVHKNYWAFQSAIKVLLNKQMDNLDKMTEEELDRLVRRLELRLSIADKLYPGQMFYQKFEVSCQLSDVVDFLGKKFYTGMSEEKFVKLKLTFYKATKEQLEYAKLNEIDSPDRKLEISSKLKLLKKTEKQFKQTFKTSYISLLEKGLFSP